MLEKGLFKVLKQGFQTIRVPRSWAKEYNWKNGDEIVITAGRRMTTAKLLIYENSYPALSRDIVNTLFLSRAPISWKVTKNEIRIGPFVAAYAFYTGKMEEPFAANTDVLQDMTRLSKELAISFYVISVGGLDPEKRIASSWIFDEKTNQWKQVDCPWPDFFIQKTITTPAKWKNVIQQELALLEMERGEMLSRDLGSKWDVFRMLYDDSSIRPFLPQTKPIQKIQDIRNMLQRYNTVYIKPARGTQGKNIYRFTRMTSDTADVQFLANIHQVKTVKLQLSKNKVWLKRRFLSKLQFLVQQGICLIHNQQGRAGDFRWLLQKDGTGEWRITARVARIGSKGGITTNVSTGGEVLHAAKFLQQTSFPNTRTAKLIKQIDQLALQIVNFLEKQVGAMGELGIDIGIDQAGKPWLIEVNPRPGRKMLKMLDRSLRELSLRRPLEYAKYTVGFSDRSAL